MTSLLKSAPKDGPGLVMVSDTLALLYVSVIQYRAAAPKGMTSGRIQTVISIFPSICAFVLLSACLSVYPFLRPFPALPWLFLGVLRFLEALWDPLKPSQPLQASQGRQIVEWMDRWMDKQMNGRMDERIDSFYTSVYLSISCVKFFFSWEKRKI